MTRRSWLLGLLLVGVVAGLGAGWWWYGRQQAPPFRVVVRGAGGTSGDLGASGGHLVVVPPGPGLFFGTVKKPGAQEQFTYLILFRYDLRKPGAMDHRGLRFRCTSEGRKVETSNAIELGGKRIEADYHLELNEARTAAEKETLTVGGQGMDLASGQVFLIDLTQEEPAYEQKKLTLPVISSRLGSPGDVERLAETIRKDLEVQDPRIKAFLR